ncbi:MAG TPA: polysaccharide deacetylase family protein [Polyangiaceae bacterium]|nr:polysaccharide deacetylase family protein [Polyangiaceae bacterium]
MAFRDQPPPERTSSGVPCTLKLLAHSSVIASLCFACSEPPSAAPAAGGATPQAGQNSGGAGVAGSVTTGGAAAGASASGGSASGVAGLTGTAGASAGSAGSASGGGGSAPFEGGAVAAVSLTYDDGLDPHLAIVQPALEAANLRGTFFLSNFEGVVHDWALPSVEQPLEALLPRHLAWQAAGQKGHELASHTVNHPCNDPNKAPNYKLTNYTQARMAAELDESVARLGRLGAKAPITFAYPCASDKAGIGPTGEDYSALVAERFAAARVSVTGIADPKSVELLRVPQRDTGGKTGDELKQMVDEVIAAKGWLVLLFHGVGTEASCNGSLVYAPDKCMINYLTTSTEAHAALVEYLAAKKAEVWTAPFGTVAARIAAARK